MRVKLLRPQPREATLPWGASPTSYFGQSYSLKLGFGLSAMPIAIKLKLRS